MEDALKDAQAIITRLQLKHYTGTRDEDLSLLHWWMDMHENGELTTMLPEHSQPLGAFLAMFRRETVLVYADPAQLWYAFWFEPCFAGRAAWISNWCHPDKRGTRDQYDATWAMHTYLFAAYPTLFAMTKQEKVIEELGKLGYNSAQKFPKLFDESNDAWITAATYDSFLASKFNHVRS